MLIVPFVCAEFHDKTGKVIHRICADELRSIVEVPEAIQQDPLFAMMVEDGSLKAPENKLELKALENDPDAKPADPAETTVKSTETDKPVCGQNAEKRAKAHVDT